MWLNPNVEETDILDKEHKIDGRNNPHAYPVSDRTPIPNSRYEKIIGNNASMVVSKTENANVQNNKESGTWNDFMNTLGSFMTANPQIIFKIK